MKKMIKIKNTKKKVIYKLIIAYLKDISTIAEKVSNNDYFKSLQYFVGILSKWSEVLVNSISFVKNSILSDLKNLIQKLVDSQKLSKLKIYTESNNISNNKLDIEILDVKEKKNWYNRKCNFIKSCKNFIILHFK